MNYDASRDVFTNCRIKIDRCDGLCLMVPNGIDDSYYPLTEQDLEEDGLDACVGSHFVIFELHGVAPLDKGKTDLVGSMMRRWGLDPEQSYECFHEELSGELVRRIVGDHCRKCGSFDEDDEDGTGVRCADCGEWRPHLGE